MQNYVSEDFMNVLDLREKLIDRIDVLNKVKELFLIPNLEMMSISQVADFYGVFTDAINKVFQRNKKEIIADGVQMLTIQMIRSLCLGHDVQESKNIKFTGTNAGSTIMSFDNQSISLSNAKAKYFSPRAVLRIGMLLRDSEVAKEVRTQLLNTFEAASSEQKTSAIDEEGKLLLDIIRAESADIAALSLKAYRDFMNRHIAEIEAEKAALKAQNELLGKENNTLSSENQAIQTELNIVTNRISEWTPNQITRKLVMAISPRCGGRPEFAWGKLRSNLFYRHGINLEGRKGESKKSFISFVREDEWTKVIQEAYLLAKDHGVDIQRCLGGLTAQKLAVAYE